MAAAGISVTAVQGKERIAEREILEALEEAADELYPETKMEDEAAAGGDDDEDIEDMLKKELATISGEPGKKSPRFRLCKRETACGELGFRQDLPADDSGVHYCACAS